MSLQVVAACCAYAPAGAAIDNVVAIKAVATPEERAAAGGFTGVARTIGASISPFFVGLMFARPALWNLSFFLAGALKIVYDVVLYRQFVGARPPEEARR